MTLDRAMLAWQVSPWWLLLTGFVGLNLIQSSLTRLCPAAMAFKAFEAVGVPAGNAFR
jgi:hypothetical protein